VKAALGDRVSVEIAYPNHDFAAHLGAEFGMHAGVGLYDVLFDVATGLGDWLFRQAAYPNEPDNSQSYFRRYYPGSSRAPFVEKLMRVRASIDGYLEDVIARYRLDEANIVGFSSMFQQGMASFALARKLKERNPRVTVVMGGPNCETPMGEVLVKSVDVLDYTFSGTALKSFPRFLELTLEGKLDERDAIPGVFGKREVERDVSQRGGEALDINADVPLDYDSYFESIESKFPAGLVEPGVTFELSRGCWWGERAHCKFCGLNGTTMDYHAMKPAKAVAFLESLFERYSSRTKRFWAVDNILPMNYPSEVFAKLKTPPDVEIWYEMKADVTEEQIRQMAEAGVTHAQAGIESLSTSQLKAMKKGTTVFTNIRALKHFLLYGVRIDWNLLVGMPDERPDMFDKYLSDLPKLFHLTAPMGTAAIRFDRYSPYFNDAASYNVKLRHLDYYDYIYPFDADTVRKIAFHFYDTNFSAPYIAAMTRSMGKLQQLVARWHRRWECQQGEPPPVLHFDSDGVNTWIVDTRAGTETRHEVTPVRRRVLEFLDRNRDVRDLEKLKSELDFDLGAELAFLRQHELVWEEDERIMSIVLPRRANPRKGALPWESSGVKYDELGRPIRAARA
jgi:ribosomal peptide maturation radical SAM protein 1